MSGQRQQMQPEQPQQQIAQEQVKHENHQHGLEQTRTQGLRMPTSTAELLSEVDISLKRLEQLKLRLSTASNEDTVTIMKMFYKDLWTNNAQIILNPFLPSKDKAATVRKCPKCGNQFFDD